MFEGWQVGLVVIATAILAVLVAVPRPVMPDEIPLPQADTPALRAISARDAQWAREADQNRLHFDLRAVGESIRSYGRADADGDQDAAVRRLSDLQLRIHPALQHGADGLLRLRAVQLQLFLNAIDRYEQTGDEPEELRELGGGIVAMLKRSGWLRSEGALPRVVPDRTVREVLFRKRWNEITGLALSTAFRLSLAEERAFFAFVLTHPVVAPSPLNEHNPTARCRAANDFLLRKVDELGRADPSYPAKYARGVLLLRLGRATEALLPLADFVEAHDDGPYVLRARNALREAQERSAELDAPR